MLLLLNVHLQHYGRPGSRRSAAARADDCIYDAAHLQRTRGRRCPSCRSRFADFAAWQHRQVGSREWESASLHTGRPSSIGAPSQLVLPFDRPRPAPPTYRGLVRTPGVRQKRPRCGLQPLSHESRARPSFCRAGWGAERRCFGATPARTTGSSARRWSTSPARGIIRADRPVPEPARAAHDLAGGPTFRDVLRRAHETVIGALDHQDLPFEQLVARN